MVLLWCTVLQFYSCTDIKVSPFHCWSDFNFKVNLRQCSCADSKCFFAGSGPSFFFRKDRIRIRPSFDSNSRKFERKKNARKWILSILDWHNYKLTELFGYIRNTFYILREYVLFFQSEKVKNHQSGSLPLYWVLQNFRKSRRGCEILHRW